MATPAVLLQSVVALAGRFPVLAGVDLSIAVGEVVVLHGSNGAGKTSLLRLLAGLLPVTTGRAYVLGIDLAHGGRDVRRHVGLLGHDPFLYDDLTVRENIEFFTRLSGAAGGVDVHAAMSRFGLDGRLAHTSAGRVSQGQRRRIGLAMVAARSPRLLLLDEPHAGLDATTRADLDAYLIESQQRGATVVYSSHEHDRITDVQSREVHIEGGQVVVDVNDGVVSRDAATVGSLREGDHVA